MGQLWSSIYDLAHPLSEVDASVSAAARAGQGWLPAVARRVGGTRAQPSAQECSWAHAWRRV